MQIGGLSLLTATIVLSPRPDTKKWRTVRLATFVATGFSAFAPIIHGAMIFPYHQLDKQAGLKYYYVEGVAIIAGVFFYAVSSSPPRYPERSLIIMDRATSQNHGNPAGSTFGELRTRYSTFLSSLVQLSTSMGSWMHMIGIISINVVCGRHRTVVIKRLDWSILFTDHFGVCTIGAEGLWSAYRTRLII